MSERYILIESFEGRNVVSYAAFKNYVAIWFYNGVFLSDPLNVLVNANDGVTRYLRQWRFRTPAEIDEEAILHYVDEAVQLEKEGRRLKPLPFKQVPIPPILQKQLTADKALRTAFYALTPGRQKEYSSFLSSAKRESTCRQRLDKIIPMILAGVGLNDKYKK